jgi:Rha family phage regulatory protein
MLHIRIAKSLQRVQMIDGKPMVDSRDVAAMFDKQHKHVLRDIEEIVSRADEKNQSNFGLVEYKDAKGESRPCYLLTRDGFTFTAMGFTGAKVRRLCCTVACCASCCGQKKKAPWQCTRVRVPRLLFMSRVLCAAIPVRGRFTVKRECRYYRAPVGYLSENP